MTMKYKTQCICQIPDWEEQSQLFPSIRYSHDHGYSGCNGTGEVEYDLDNLDEIDGEFSNVVVWSENKDDEIDIGEYDEDIIVRFTCNCGNEMFFSEGGNSVCSCGRVYRLNVYLEKNNTHKGDMEYWDKIKASKYKRFGDENDND